MNSGCLKTDRIEEKARKFGLVSVEIILRTDVETFFISCVLRFKILKFLLISRSGF